MTGSETSTAFNILPYKIDNAAATLDDIRDRVRAFRWDAWSEPADAGDWRYGPPSSFMRELCAYWLDQYDWHLQERAMNALPHFITPVDNVDIHFIHEQGSGPNPAPLLIAWLALLVSLVRRFGRPARTSRATWRTC